MSPENRREIERRNATPLSQHLARVFQIRPDSADLVVISALEAVLEHRQAAGDGLTVAYWNLVDTLRDWQSRSPKLVYSALAQDDSEDWYGLEFADDSEEAGAFLLGRAGDMLAGS